jgi:hypothetical protein
MPNIFSFSFVHWYWAVALGQTLLEIVSFLLLAHLIYGNLYWLWTMLLSAAGFKKPGKNFL